MWNFLVQRGMVCSSKLTSASSLRSKCHGQVRRQKASTSYQGRCRRQPPTVCRDGQRRPPHSRAKPASSISSRWKMRSRPITKEKTLVNRPCAQGAVVVRETVLGGGQPVQGLRHQQERARVLGPRREKGGGGSGTGWLGGTVATDDRLGGQTASGCCRRRLRRRCAAARVARSRPNFLQKWCKATVETWTLPGALDEVEDVVARGVGMGQDELGDGAGIAGQQFAVGPAGHAVVGRLDRLLGRDALLVRGRGPADADQAGDLRDLEPGVAVEQEMAEQAAGDSNRRRSVAGRQRRPATSRVARPSVDRSAICAWESHCAKSAVRGSHEKSSLKSWPGRIVVRKDRKLSVRARKTVWC